MFYEHKPGLDTLYPFNLPLLEVKTLHFINLTSQKMFLQQIDHNIKRLLSLSADVLVQVDYTTGLVQT